MLSTRWQRWIRWNARSTARVRSRQYRSRPVLIELEPRIVPTGLTPAQIQHIYGIDQIKLPGGVTANGQGQTIAIIDAGDFYNSVTGHARIFDDLHQFDTTYGIADPPNFLLLDQYGSTNYPGPVSGAYEEEALDVEWAHALAPAANLIMFEANSLSNADLYAAVYSAAHYNGALGQVSVVSMSFGEPENLDTEALYDNYFTTPSGHPGITFVAAAGDDGAGYQFRLNNDTGGIYPPEYPAVSPNVLGVGGTTLTFPSGDMSDYPGVATSSGGVGEEGWGNSYLSYYRSNTPGGGSGGGPSSYEPMPNYQYNYGLRYTNGLYNVRMPRMSPSTRISKTLR